MRSASQRKSSSGKSANTENFRTSSMMCWICVPLSVSVISHRAQVLMHELNCVCSFADARRHAFYGTIAYISRDKNARNTCFQKPRIAVQRPAFGPLPVRHQIGSRQKKALFFAQQYIRQPFRARRSADEHKQVVRRNSLYFAAG